MLMLDEDVIERLESKDNLLNKIGLSVDRRAAKKEIIDIPALPANRENEDKKLESHQNINAAPTIDDLIDNVNVKVDIGKAHLNAIEVLNSSLHELKYRVQEIEKPEKLAAIASQMHKIIHDNSGKDDDSKTGKNQVIIWKPMMIDVNELSVVSVAE